MNPPRQQYIVGVDIGGTNIVVGALPDDGSRELGVHSEPTAAVDGGRTSDSQPCADGVVPSDAS